MPIRYRCKSCGHVIYEFKRVGQDYTGVPTPHEIIRLTGGVCPACKRPLEAPNPEDYRSYIIVKPRVFTATRPTPITTPTLTAREAGVSGVEV